MYEFMIYDPGRLPQWPTKSGEFETLEALCDCLWVDLDNFRLRGRYQVGIQITSPTGGTLLQGTRVDIDDATLAVLNLRKLLKDTR